jgi:tetrahydromethanopterin S-methyltransferase subunit B
MTQATEVSEVLKLFQVIQSDIQDIKISQTRTEEKVNALELRFGDLDKSLSKRMDSLEQSLNKRIDSLEQRNIAQDVRFWGFLGIIVTALIALLSKLAFFPGSAA